MNSDSLIKVLFLAADPRDASRLRLQQEYRDIEERLQLAKQRERFRLKSRLSVRIGDITQAIFDVEPQIVHFSGHGTSMGVLCFENELGYTQPVDPSALAAMFELFAEQVNCVVLNACYSEDQAKAIAKHIQFVIGMNRSIGDKAAITFAVGFYKALGANRSIDVAYKFGRAEIQLQGISEELTPVLYEKKDVKDNLCQAKWILVLSATINEVDKPLAEAMIAHLRQISGDASLTLKRIESGSVKLVLEGSQNGLELIEALFKEGKLTEILGIPIQDVQTEAQSLLLFKSVEEIFQLLFNELKQSTEASEQKCWDVAMRLAAEVNRISAESKRIQDSGAVETWVVNLARYRLQQCLKYYQLGSNQARVELHTTLSSIVYRYINPAQTPSNYQARLTLIEDFLQGFYVEAWNVFRRENLLTPTYRPQSLLELAEYMAFSERYGKRRIPLPGGRQQQLIILRAQTFSQQQPPETYDLDQAAEGTATESDSAWEEAAMHQVREVMVAQKTEPTEETLRQVVENELMAYLQECQQNDCANYFALRLQNLSAHEIQQTLGLSHRQLDYLQQRFKYHLIRFALMHRWELVHEWLEADLERNLGLTPQQWRKFEAQLDPQQRQLLQLKQQRDSLESIAQTLGLTVSQIQKRWFKLLEQAWEIRNSLVSGTSVSTQEQ